MRVFLIIYVFAIPPVRMLTIPENGGIILSDELFRTNAGPASFRGLPVPIGQRRTETHWPRAQPAKHQFYILLTKDNHIISDSLDG